MVLFRGAIEQFTPLMAKCFPLCLEPHSLVGELLSL